MAAIPFIVFIIALNLPFANIQGANNSSQDSNYQKDSMIEVKKQKYGESFSMGYYVFEDSLFLSIREGGHKRSYKNGPFKSWVDVSLKMRDTTFEFSLFCQRANLTAPITYSEEYWNGYLIKRLGDNEFVVTKQIISNQN